MSYCSLVVNVRPKHKVDFTRLTCCFIFYKRILVTEVGKHIIIRHLRNASIAPISHFLASIVLKNRLMRKVKKCRHGVASTGIIIEKVLVVGREGKDKRTRLLHKPIFAYKMTDVGWKVSKLDPSLRSILAC
jgi:hypothetical protein